MPFIVIVVLLVATAVWHALAVWHFAFNPARTIGRTTAERPISPIAVELLRFLGAMNAAFVVLAIVACFSDLSGLRVAFATLAAANLSQALVDLRVLRLDLVRGPMFRQILIGDLVFTALNGAALMLSWT